MWNFRFWIEDHDMTIISIDGADVKPIFIPAKKPGEAFSMNGIELAASERYDVLITADQTGRKDFVIHVDRCVFDCRLLDLRSLAYPTRHPK